MAEEKTVDEIKGELALAERRDVDLAWCGLRDILHKLDDVKKLGIWDSRQSSEGKLSVAYDVAYDVMTNLESEEIIRQRLEEERLQ